MVRTVVGAGMLVLGTDVQQTLPVTGSSTVVPLVVGAVATATGVALLLVRRRSPRR